MPVVNAIMACDKDGGFAKNGTLPWPKNQADFNWFKMHTMHSTVIMGSGTWLDPIFPKPLKNRTNIVLSRQNPDLFPGADLVYNGDDFLDHVTTDTAWIIGGGEVIEKYLPLIDNFYLTFFEQTYDCDRYIPINKIFEWENVFHESHEELSFFIFKQEK
jgi:dihydrofolate reductase